MTPAELSAVLKPLIQTIREASTRGWYDFFIGGLTTLSLGLVGWSTVLTRRMQKAAKTQADAALAMMREAQLQRENSTRQLGEMATQTRLSVIPVVVFTVTPSPSGAKVFMQNTGKGPAFNIAFTVTTDGIGIHPRSFPDILKEGQVEQIELILWTKEGDSSLMFTAENIHKRPNATPTVLFEIQLTDLAARQYRTLMALEHPFGGPGFRLLSHELVARTEV